jgi:predicted membrane protein
MDKLSEILEELRLVLAGRSNILDSILPPLLFVLLNAIWGMQVAIWASLGLAVAIAILRLLKRQTLLYALGGAGGVALAAAIAYLLGRAEGFFLPTMISGGVTVLLCLVSVLVGRPLVAVTSFVARRWPLNWYWHPKVRPAYSEVTWLWVIFFGLRLLLQFNLFQDAATSLLGIVQLLTGWPATITLLIISYLYGTWRLRNLRGPSVEEFKSGAEPPWEGQQRGF